VSLLVQHSGATHRGLVREKNEDQWIAVPELGLYVVSDGLGGEFAGALASKIVVEALPEMIRARTDVLRDLSSGKASRAIKEALVELSIQVFDQTHGQPGLEGMGATVVLALIRQTRVLIAHMGDSRAYLLRRGRLKLLTKDHSVVQLLVDAGEISQAETASHPARGRVTRSIGMEGEPLPKVRVVEVQPGDRLLLCTDGLTGMVGVETIRSILKQDSDPEPTCRQLIQAALDSGGEDNVTSVVVAIAGDRADDGGELRPKQ
jgi:protein phosphatase